MARKRLLEKEPEYFNLVNTKIAKFAKVSKEQYEKDLKANGFPIEDCLKVDEIPYPVRGSKRSAGYDIATPVDFVLNPGESVVIPTGLCCDMYEGWCLIAIPRSGSGFKYKIQLANTVGLIDGDYFMADNEGHILLKLFNDNREGKTWVVSKGDRIAQAVFLFHGLTVDDIAEMERTGGFGSTGK